MPEYEVTMGFRPSLSLLFKKTTYSVLPADPVCVAGLRIELGSDHDYTAATHVVAPDIVQAGETAHARLDEVLAALAIMGHVFVHDAGSGHVRQADCTFEGAAADLIKRWRDTYAKLDSRIVMMERVGVQKSVGSMEEVGHLAERIGSARDNVRRAVDLHYLAMQAPNDEVEFMLIMASVECLVNLEQSPRPILTRLLSKTDRTALVRNAECLFRSSGLCTEERDKLIGRLTTTHGVPMAQRLADYLTSCGATGIAVEGCRRWWKMRGTLVHGGEVDPAELRDCLPSLREAGRSALTRVLSDQPQPRLAAAGQAIPDGETIPPNAGTPPQP